MIIKNIKVINFLNKNCNSSIRCKIAITYLVIHFRNQQRQLDLLMSSVCESTNAPLSSKCGKTIVNDPQ